MDSNNKIFWELIKDEFTNKVLPSNKGKKTNSPSSTKPANFSKLPPLQLSPRPLKKVLENFKFHSKNTPDKNQKAVESGKPLYAQVSSKNIGNILKIKKNFPELSNK